MEVQGDRCAHQHDAHQLEDVAEPPAEVVPFQHQLREQRCAEPDHADDHHQVGAAGAETAITPLLPTSTPGVAIPWTTSSPVIAVNAVPRRTVRPSLRRAPAIVSAIAAAAATVAPIAMNAKCTPLGG